MTVGDNATWFLGPDGNANDFNIYRWSSSSSLTYSDGYATQLSVSANGSILLGNGNGTLKVEGCILMICQAQTWKRS